MALTHNVRKYWVSKAEWCGNEKLEWAFGSLVCARNEWMYIARESHLTFIRRRIKKYFSTRARSCTCAQFNILSCWLSVVIREEKRKKCAFFLTKYIKALSWRKKRNVTVKERVKFPEIPAKVNKLSWMCITAEYQKISVWMRVENKSENSILIITENLSLSPFCGNCVNC